MDIEKIRPENVATPLPGGAVQRSAVNNRNENDMANSEDEDADRPLNRHEDEAEEGNQKSINKDKVKYNKDNGQDADAWKNQDSGDTDARAFDKN